MPNLPKCSWEKWSLNIVWKLFFFKNKFFQKYIFLICHTHLGFLAFKILSLKIFLLKFFLKFQFFFNIFYLFIFFSFFKRKVFNDNILKAKNPKWVWHIKKKNFFEKIYFWKKKFLKKYLKTIFPRTLW